MDDFVQRRTDVNPFDILRQAVASGEAFQYATTVYLESTPSLIALQRKEKHDDIVALLRVCDSTHPGLLAHRSSVSGKWMTALSIRNAAPEVSLAVFEARVRIGEVSVISNDT